MTPNKETFPSDGGAAADSTPVAIYTDVLTEILIQLPAKYLLRLQLVSKHWRSVISSDEFDRRRRRHHQHRTLLLQSLFNVIKIKSHQTPMISPHTFPFPYPKILSSCNGLMLLESDSYYYVHNPTTNQSRRILLRYSPEFPCIKGLTLAFDPSKSSHYIIVLVRAAFKSDGVFSDPDRSCLVEVYHSESRSWNVGSEPFTLSPEPSFSAGVHCNNLIYWNGNKTLCYYDIGEKSISTLAISTGSYHSEIQESKGKLYSISHEGETVRLWELMGSNSWFLKYSCRIGFFPPSYGGRLSIRYDGEEDSFVFHSSGEIMVYRAGENLEVVVDLRFRGLCQEHLKFTCLYLFDETLALV